MLHSPVSMVGQAQAHKGKTIMRLRSDRNVYWSLRKVAPHAVPVMMLAGGTGQKRMEIQ
jgi:hypothetical protein